MGIEWSHDSDRGSFGDLKLKGRVYKPKGNLSRLYVALFFFPQGGGCDYAVFNHHNTFVR